MSNTKEKLWMDIFNRHPDLVDKILEIYDELEDDLMEIFYTFIKSDYDKFVKPIKEFYHLKSFKEISVTDKSQIVNTDK